jgi:DNA-binding response OmpR family regulator
MPQPKVLIVDDDPNSRAVLGDALASEPYTLLEACNGEEALDIILRETPDLILLDMMMPNIDGNGVLRTLRDRRKTRPIPVILVTALDILNTQVCEALGDDAVDHICKPFSGAVVRARVRAALRSHTLGAKESPSTSTEEATPERNE